MKLGSGMRDLAARVLWHANRTPAGRLIKLCVAALDFPNKQERRRLARDFSEPTELVAVLGELRREGWAPVTGQLEGELVEQLAKEAQDRVSRATELEKCQLRRNKAFWLRLLDSDIQRGELDVDSVFVRFALQEPVLRLVTAYFGEVPLLAYVLLSLSRHVGDDWQVSQLWHRDYDDTKVLKMFTYLSEVPDESYGPFTLLPRRASGRVRHVGWRSHVHDAAVFRWIDPRERRQVTGPALTTFFVDTRACYHMGSRVKPGRTRLMYTAAFISAPPIYPGFTNQITAKRPLTRLEQLVLTP